MEVRERLIERGRESRRMKKQIESLKNSKSRAQRERKGGIESVNWVHRLEKAGLQGEVPSL